MKRTLFKRMMLSGLAIIFALASVEGRSQKPANKKEAKPPMFKHGYKEVNGVRLHYATAGKGKLIMFVHGFPEFWYEWKN